MSRPSPRVLIASRAFDTAAGRGEVSRLEEAGLRVERLAGPELNDAAVAARVVGSDAIVLGSETLSCPSMCAAESLELIVRTGKGVDNIAQDCPRLGVIQLTVVDDVNTRAVAEFTVLAILAALRRLPVLVEGVRAGAWSKVIGDQLSGKVVGLVGFGRIGEDVATLLGPFDCELVAFDPYKDPGEWRGDVRRAETLEALLADADVVSLHAPGGSQARLGRDALAALKAGAIVVNTARGSLLDLDAVTRLVAEGRLGGAVVDVYDEEPFPFDEVARPGDANLLLTPHVAGHTNQALDRFAARSVDLILEWHAAREAGR